MCFVMPRIELYMTFLVMCVIAAVNLWISSSSWSRIPQLHLTLHSHILGPLRMKLARHALYRLSQCCRPRSPRLTVQAMSASTAMKRTREVGDISPPPVRRQRTLDANNQPPEPVAASPAATVTSLTTSKSSVRHYPTTGHVPDLCRREGCYKLLHTNIRESPRQDNVAHHR